MSSFPASPRLIKGAIVALDSFNPLASIVIFQYNPAELTRTLTPKGSGDDKTPIGTQRLTGPPKESITLRVTIDAANQLQQGDRQAATMGIYPQLAALEMLLYPKSSLVLANTALAALGTLELEPPVPPLTLFIWGEKRVVPVTLSSYSVTEQYHDPNLNPIVAEANLTLDVLSYADFLSSQRGYYVFLAHQVVKEAMATLGSINNIGDVAGGNIRIT